MISSSYLAVPMISSSYLAVPMISSSPVKTYKCYLIVVFALFVKRFLLKYLIFLAL